MRIGHPKKGEVREKLIKLSVKFDQATFAALAELEAAVPDNVKVGRRSEALRIAIHEARSRLSTQSTQNKEPTT